MVLFFRAAISGLDRFSYTTVLKRWPVILANAVDQIAREDHALHLLLQTESNAQAKKVTEEKLTEGKAVIEQISKLKYQMARDHPLPYVGFCHGVLTLSSPGRFRTMVNPM